MKSILAGETIVRTSPPTSNPNDDGDDDNEDYVKSSKAENLLVVEFKKLVKMEEGSNNNRCSGTGPRGGGKRRHYRRPKKEHDAIDFLRRAVYVIAVIELVLGLSESSLVSTFFLFLTMSTTFDVKPENIIDTYCYRQPGGNRMCEDYMRRSTGYTPSTMHHYRAASTNSRSYFNYNFPNVSPSVEDQAYELFLAFNQTLFDDPVNFNLQLELDSSSRNETLAKVLQLYLAEMEKSTSDMNRTNNNDKPALSNQKQKMKLLTSLLKSYFSERLTQTVEMLKPFPSLPPSKIPQVMDAMRRAKLRSQNQNHVKTGNKVGSGPAPELKREEFDKLAYHLSPTPASPLSSSSHLHGSQSRYKVNNMIQNQDFIHHRWKRQSQGGIITPHTPLADEDAPSKQPIQKVFQGRLNRQESSQVGEEEVKLTEPEIKATRGTPTKQEKEKGFSLGANGNEQQSNVKRELMKEKKPETLAPIQTSVKAGGKEEMQGNHDHEHNIADEDHHHPTLILDTEPSPISIRDFSSTSPPPPSTTTEHSSTKGGDGDDVVEAFKKYMRVRLPTTRPDPEKRLSMESYLTLAMMSRQMTDSDSILKKMRNELKEQVTQQHPKSEHQLGSSPPSKKKNTKLSTKYIQELYAKLGKSPRHLLALMEASLFNNWGCFLGLTKIVYRNHGGKAGSSPCLECLAADIDFVPDFPSSEATRMEIMQNLSLNMVMDIFHPHTFLKAERRKRAMQQAYHDYSSTIMMVLTDQKDLSVSHSFYKVFSTIKMYTFFWHLTLFSVLILGSLFEDKTALNIWGIFAILTSILHFIIEEWIDTNIEPDKTAACLWFSIIFRVYKPVAVLVVLTLSSEILKRDGSSSSSPPSKQRGLGLFELVWGKKPGKKQSEKGSDGGGGGDTYPPTVTVTKVQFRRAELENGKIVYTNLSPSKTGLYTRATCVICGATAKLTKHRATSGGVDDPTTNPDGVENTNENERNNFPKNGLQCSCSKATILATNEIFDVSEDDDEDEDGEEQEVEIVGDEEEEDTDEEDGYEYEQEKQEEDPIMNVDQELRQSNKNGRKKQAAMVVILSEGKKYGMNKKDESEGKMGKQGKIDTDKDDKNNNTKGAHLGVNQLIVGDGGNEGVAVVDGANLYI